VSASFDCHIPEELLDEFVMEMLSEQDYEFWEEHLLICATCQDRLAQADQYVAVIKSAAARLRTGSLDLGLDSDAVAMAGEI